MNIQQMMRKAQQMQKELKDAQEEIAKMTFTSEAGGGTVKVTATGNLRIQSIEIDPESEAATDIEVMQDLVTIAVNKALEDADKASNARVSSVSAKHRG